MKQQNLQKNSLLLPTPKNVVENVFKSQISTIFAISKLNINSSLKYISQLTVNESSQKINHFEQINLFGKCQTFKDALKALINVTKQYLDQTYLLENILFISQNVFRTKPKKFYVTKQ